MKIYLVADSSFLKLSERARAKNVLFTKYSYSKKAFAWFRRRKLRELERAKGVVA